MEYQISITQDGVISYPMHKHTFCEIMLYLEGNGYLRTDTGNIPFESGTARNQEYPVFGARFTGKSLGERV